MDEKEAQSVEAKLEELLEKVISKGLTPVNGAIASPCDNLTEGERSCLFLCQTIGSILERKQWQRVEVTVVDDLIETCAQLLLEYLPKSGRESTEAISSQS